MGSLTGLYAEMMAHRPDFNEPQPLSNRRETIFGAVFSFTLISTFALGLRLYTRFAVLKCAWWDDFFVILAYICNVIGTICVGLAVDKGGLGKHFLSLSEERMSLSLKFYYLDVGTYITNCALIKISLLFQYLRLFESGTTRKLCYLLIVVVIIWGIAFGFLAWFPVWPVYAYWDFSAKAKWTSYKQTSSFIAVFVAHSALNMVLDSIILFLPATLYLKAKLRSKQVLALSALFMLGSLVLVIAIWRLYSIIKYRAATSPYPDFTWWPPIMVILSSLEVSIAIMCASIPIFWPVLQKSLNQIFVTHEVRINHEHRRLDDYELENAGGESRSGAASLKSRSSQERLAERVGKMGHGPVDVVGVHSDSGGRGVDGHYKDQYVIEQVDPLQRSGCETTAVGAKGPNW